MLPIKTDIADAFFQEETRCDYVVTRERKALWAIEIDLLNQLNRVCQDNGLRYCVGAGTLLGTIRHKGFIPWDDDVDVYMLREDYDRLMELADEFKAPYFLQNSSTEKNLMRSFARLRNSNTLGATTREINLPINKGVFIDIFPLDGISPDRFMDLKQKVINRTLKNVCGCFNYSKTLNRPSTLTGRFKIMLYKLVSDVFAHNKEKTYCIFERNLKKYSDPSTEMWGNRTLVFDCPKSRRPYLDWTDIIWKPFEMISVPVPRKYDQMLRQQYGDYEKIPKEKGKNMHGELIISVDHSFEDLRRINN